jgi:hypothetical protein
MLYSMVANDPLVPAPVGPFIGVFEGGREQRAERLTAARLDRGQIVGAWSLFLKFEPDEWTCPLGQWAG